MRDPDAVLEAAEAPSQDVVEAAPFPGKWKPGQPRHEPIAPELVDELALAVGKGLALLGISEDAEPNAVVARLARYADGVRAGNERMPSDRDDAVLALGCLYGQAVGRALAGWGFAHLRCTKKPGIVVVSADRRYAFGPRSIVAAALERGGEALSEHFASLADPRRLPPSAPGRYLRVS